jgi:hypothetical protein
MYNTYKGQLSERYLYLGIFCSKTYLAVAESFWVCTPLLLSQSSICEHIQRSSISCRDKGRQACRSVSQQKYIQNYIGYFFWNLLPYVYSSWDMSCITPGLGIKYFALMVIHLAAKTDQYMVFIMFLRHKPCIWMKVTMHCTKYTETLHTLKQYSLSYCGLLGNDTFQHDISNDSLQLSRHF